MSDGPSRRNLTGLPRIGNQPGGRGETPRLWQAVAAIHGAYERYRMGFREITRRARERFEQRDWSGAQADARDRLAGYRMHVDAAVADVRDILGDSVMERTQWAALKTLHHAGLAGRFDPELAQTFFNSVTRRIFATVGVDSAIEYLDPLPSNPDTDDERTITVEFQVARVAPAVVRRILDQFSWSVPYDDLEHDAAVAADAIEAALQRLPTAGMVTIHVVRAVFYRNKGAYLVGRIRRGNAIIPLVLPLLRTELGIALDAVLLTENEASVVFGFSWSYFRVEAPRPRALVGFLGSIMPLKRIDELYNAIGFNKHGKSELYRSLVTHLEDPGAQFAFAEGEEGMVMAVFTLPALNLVFKVIKNHFGAPKNTTRQAVMERYHFVFVRDRVGRLADAQEFEHLEFPRRCFPDDLLAYLLASASQTVRVEGDRVIVRHGYTERRVTPLNLFLQRAGDGEARDAVVEYGNAIKDLAAADIFTGDMLLKNFGVTRNGRVICYDYDELCLLSECTFRRIPPPRSIDEEFSSEPYFHVGERDIFPEEFPAFLVPAARLRETFLASHGELLTVEYWRGVQERLRAGEVVDVFPYRRSAFLKRASGG